MGASRFVGRVGGLAVALGVGAAVFSTGYGVAWASGGDAGGQTQASGSSGGGANAAGPRASRGGGAKAAASRPSARNNRGVQAAAPAADGPVTPAASVRRAALRAPAVSAPAPAPSSAVTSVVGVVENQVTGGAGGNPVAPIENPLSLALLEASRRSSPVAAASTANATAAVVANATVTQGSLSVNPTVGFVDGIIQGTLGAVSSTGQTLSYSFVGSSDGGKLTIGNVPNSPTTKDPQSYTALPYGTWLNGTNNPTPTGTQTFSVRVSEVTGFDKFVTGIPLLGLLASPIINLLQQTPLLSGLLAPVIGNAVTATITADLSTLVPAGKNVAFTYKVESFDGTLISTNFFPALDNSKVGPDNLAFTVLNGPGLGSAGVTDPYGTNQAAGSAPGLSVLRGSVPGSGFNVITWDPRGEFASGGVLQLDNPMFEGRDVSAIMDWATANTPAVAVAGDIKVGMTGGSYGGGIQMTTVDPRIDAIIPAIAWNSLNQSLYPDNVFKTGWANTLFLALLETGARINNQIPLAILTGDLFGWISQTAQAVLASSGPTALLTKLDIPTLFVQGTIDALFPLDQAVTNIETLLEQNPWFATRQEQAKMIWFCGGHGVCLDPVNLTAQATAIFSQNMAWLNTYVKGVPAGADQIPTFQWWDQAGQRYAAGKLPFQDGFATAPLTQSTDGGFLGIAPFAFLGSGPNTSNCAVASACSFPLNQVFATPTDNSLKVNFTPTAGTKIVGTPTVSFTYQGLGTSRAVYAQVVDNKTGRVLGNIVTPIPVTLDGREHTVDVPIANIAYTAPAEGASLTVQIVPSASLYWNSSFGVVNIANLSVDLPTTAQGVPLP